VAEILDKVDARDRVLGTTTKHEAHEKGFIHRVSAVFVFTDDRKILVQLRGDNNLLDHSVGGHVRSGEVYEAAAARETEEELGVDMKLKQIGKFLGDERLAKRAPGFQVVHYFTLYEGHLGKKDIGKLRLLSEEVKEVIPMDLEELREMMGARPLSFSPGFMHSYNFYVAKKKLGLPKVNVV
jgi:isopentenyldiphosphate isomerase